jgi:hypothetical protein
MRKFLWQQRRILFNVGVPSQARESVMTASEEHPQKASSPIVVNKSGSVMDVSDEHRQKAQPPIVVSETGSVMDLSEEQSWKALS